MTLRLIAETLMAAVLKDGITADGSNIMDSAESPAERQVFEHLLDAVASSNLDIRTKIEFVKRIKELNNRITATAVERGKAITQVLDLDSLLFINSGLRVDLSKSALEKNSSWRCNYYLWKFRRYW